MVAKAKPLIAVSAEQAAVLAAVDSLRTTRQRWPTVYEVARLAGISPSRARRLVCRLIDLGCLEWPGHVALVRKPDGFMLVERPEGGWIA